MTLITPPASDKSAALGACSGGPGEQLREHSPPRRAWGTPVTSFSRWSQQAFPGHPACPPQECRGHLDLTPNPAAPLVLEAASVPAVPRPFPGGLVNSFSPSMETNSCWHGE